MLEANNREFVLSDNAYEYPENYAIEWSHEHDFSILEQHYEILTEDPQIVSGIYQGI